MTKMCADHILRESSDVTLRQTDLDLVCWLKDSIKKHHFHIHPFKVRMGYIAYETFQYICCRRVTIGGNTIYNFNGVDFNEHDLIIDPNINPYYIRIEWEKPVFVGHDTKFASLDDIILTPKDFCRFPKIKKVIFNDPATIVMWSDGTKTVVKCQEGDTFDPEKGLAMCVVKKMFGLKDFYKSFNPAFNDWLKNLDVEENIWDRIRKITS